MRKVALVINTDKPLALEAGYEILHWLVAQGIQPLVEPGAAQLLGRADLALPAGDAWGEAELLVVLGGDGTLIRAVKAVAPFSVPVLGINTGHLGFLTEIETPEIFSELGSILAGEYVLEERMMLTASVQREGRQLVQTTALNDAVISKGPQARLIHLGVLVGETQVARYPADGVIVATPTGSTAYSLSAGGPIVEPTVDCMLITPICPHTISARSIVVGGGEKVSVTILESPGEVGLSADGSDPFGLLAGDRVVVGRAPYTAKLVRRPTYNFYNVLRQKMADR